MVMQIHLGNACENCLETYARIYVFKMVITKQVKEAVYM